MPFTLSLMELFDIAIMSVVLGVIFKDIFRSPVIADRDYDPIKQARKSNGLEDFKFAIMVTAPAIILHELAHKTVAVAYGLEATFHAAYTWLGIGVLLKVLGTGIIFFVPAFVSMSGQMTPFVQSMVAFAGPAMNLVIFIGAWAYEKKGKPKRKWLPFILLTKKINGFLFVFNMLPIPPFDGFKVFQGLYQTIF